MPTDAAPPGAPPRPGAPAPRVRPRLVTSVAESMTTAIVTGTYPAGTALPPEGALGELYGVSRTVVRESTTALAEKGLVSSQQGRGTIVLDEDRWNLLDPMVLAALYLRDDRLEFLDSLIATRTALECEMASAAAGTLSEQDADDLAAVLDAMGALIDDPEEYARQDVVFHDRIMRASGNRLGRAVVNGIQGKALDVAQYQGRPDRAHTEATHADHLAILAALREHDEDAAARAMRAHILGSWARRRPRDPDAG
ncbi:FadR/GntR family transcriptional regulator [Cellulomonas hominis]|uniref:FadR/GntR family transcriptional regulator n=1 Tax=Cellulomonas hominis TaxID=156981 RepID=UPI0027E0EA94|nr:FadR/GntR family transcriptional regulator [Cellulomonas hominis]